MLALEKKFTKSALTTQLISIPRDGGVVRQTVNEHLPFSFETFMGRVIAVTKHSLYSNRELCWESTGE